ncbi:phosphotransferase [Bacillus sp. ISL-35]|uniref:phosphotransferase n=1 Tax=Bacillus sp. ISL-35 TaxID=2819122 RepID=UPI001BE7E224|nr:phosphotransferase [Bacillus sp. ISL-35]MBT2680433.1 phosphotransferase [Bacillus sp. ISL-35]MBT2704274.1 phosphotransferase [Chryseobacterium sp. ISL-80]
MVVETEIKEEIFEAVTRLFGIEIQEWNQIHLGYRNLKWRVKTAAGDLFVKQYNKDRYPEARVPGLEKALQIQNTLFLEGLPCPELFSYKGNFVLNTENGERFVLMGFNKGFTLRPGTANPSQMHILGKVIGRMHVLLEKNIAREPLHWDILSKPEMLENWNERYDETIALDCSKTLHQLEKQRRILAENDTSLFAQCEKGWAHWDLFADNILFSENEVSSILDFDRMNVVYTDFDISRPILSCCIHENQISVDGVSAFVSGYREFKPLPLEKLVRSIKLTWWREAEWIRVEKPGDSTPIKRFREENIWIAENWDCLEDLFSGI